MNKKKEMDKERESESDIRKSKKEKEMYREVRRDEWTKKVWPA